MAAPVVYRVPRRFITFPEDPPPYGFLAVSFLAHMACFGAALALSAFLGSRIDQSKVYIVNLVPATPSLGSPAAEPPAPTVRAPAGRHDPPRRAPKAEEKAPPKAARPEPPRPERAPGAGRRAAAAARARSRRRPAEDARALGARPAPARREGEPRPSAARPPGDRAQPAAAAARDPAGRGAHAPDLPAAAARAPADRGAARGSHGPGRTAGDSGPEPARRWSRSGPAGPTRPSVSGSNLSVDASDFPFTYYLRSAAREGIASDGGARSSSHPSRSRRWSTSRSTGKVSFEASRRSSKARGTSSTTSPHCERSSNRCPSRLCRREFPGQYLKVNFGFDPGINRG